MVTQWNFTLGIWWWRSPSKRKKYLDYFTTKNLMHFAHEQSCKWMSLEIYPDELYKNECLSKMYLIKADGYLQEIRFSCKRIPICFVYKSTRWKPCVVYSIDLHCKTQKTFNHFSTLTFVYSIPQRNWITKVPIKVFRVSPHTKVIFY